MNLWAPPTEWGVGLDTKHLKNLVRLFLAMGDVESFWIGWHYVNWPSERRQKWHGLLHFCRRVSRTEMVFKRCETTFAGHVTRYG